MHDDIHTCTCTCTSTYTNIYTYIYIHNIYIYVDVCIYSDISWHIMTYLKCLKSELVGGKAENCRSPLAESGLIRLNLPVDPKLSIQIMGGLCDLVDYVGWYLDNDKKETWLCGCIRYKLWFCDLIHGELYEFKGLWDFTWTCSWANLRIHIKISSYESQMKLINTLASPRWTGHGFLSVLDGENILKGTKIKRCQCTCYSWTSITCKY